jgi:hypothetical protein
MGCDTTYGTQSQQCGNNYFSETSQADATYDTAKAKCDQGYQSELLKCEIDLTAAQEVVRNDWEECVSVCAAARLFGGAGVPLYATCVSACSAKAFFDSLNCNTLYAACKQKATIDDDDCYLNARSAHIAAYSAAMGEGNTCATNAYWAWQGCTMGCGDGPMPCGPPPF